MTPNRNFIIKMFAMIVVALAILAAAAYAYATFGAALVYGYDWLAGDAPVFDCLTVAAWTAPIVMVAIFRYCQFLLCKEAG